MKNNIFFICIIFMLSCSQTNKKQPAIYQSKYGKDQMTHVLFSPSSFIFDTIATGKNASGFFYIINAGKNILKIDSITKNCSCTTFDDHPKDINPGDSLQFKFSIQPGQRDDYFASVLIFYFNTKPFFRQYLIEGYAKK